MTLEKGSRPLFRQESEAGTAKGGTRRSRVVAGGGVLTPICDRVFLQASELTLPRFYFALCGRLERKLLLAARLR